MILNDFLARLGDLELDPDGYRGHCPSHDDSQASLRVAVSDKGKVLIKCRAGCETKDVMEAMSLTMRDLASMEVGDWSLPTATSTDRPADPAAVAALAVQLDGYAEALVDEGCEEALEYAERRFGIDAHTAARLGLGIARDLPGGPRLVVPFRDKDGVARGYQARALEKDAQVRWYGPRSPEGASWSRIAYFEGGSGWDEVIVAEGPGDGLTGVGIGYDTIAIRGAGLASNETVVDEVADLIGDRLAVIAGDGDPSGRTFASRLAQALVARDKRVKILPVPDDHDLTSWRERDGARFATNVIRAISDTREETSVDAVLRDRDTDRYPLTDLGNARFARDFITAQQSGVKFSPEVGFHLLHRGVWRSDRLDRTRAYVQEAAERTAAIAHALPDGPAGTDQAKQKKAWISWARHSQSSRGIDAAIKELGALTDVATDVNDFDQHPDLLAVGNGVIDLRTGTLMPHDPALLLTRQLQIEFDPDAACPRWESFLDEVFPDHAEMPNYLQRLVGYGITGHTVEQTFSVLWGTGANGKSVFTDTLTEVFREFTVTTPFSTFEDKASGGIPNDLAALKGARLVMAAEGEQGRPMAEAVLKRVTGRDLIAARFMRKEFFEFRPSFLLMLATNFKPNFKGQDEGLWRRVKLIPWERYFAPEERDHRLGDKLLRERQGILAWAVRGSVAWHRHGLQDPPTIISATEEYRHASDVLEGFVPGVYIPVEGAKVEAKRVFDDFMAYADEGNYQDLRRWSSRALYRALEERGYVRRRSTGGRYVFEGLRRARPTDLHQPEEEVEEVRAEPTPLAHSSSSTPTRGPSLSDVL